MQHAARWWAAAALAVAANGGRADEPGPGFRVHTIRADSRFEAATIADLNGDGRPDVFCGGFWYEAPRWTPHSVREVAEIDGYHADFGAIPIDLDGDGLVDVVGASWHRRDVYWLRNPGQPGEPWTLRTIDTPGPIETVFAADLDGDGRPDILPNVVGRPAWYSFRRDPTADGGVRWTRHDLPGQAGTHGLGAGDIDGDGRTDVATPRGWLANSPTGWIWHAEYDMKERASIPIMVGDWDGDGDADIVWGSAHGYGVRWLEQTRDASGRREWRRADMDTSWSQAHTFVAADLDGDGRLELITGKRYYAHNGKDPSAEDPRLVAAYSWEPRAKTWRRRLLSHGGATGFGISAAAADIDGDGDIDLVCPGKSGLYWIENLRR